MKTWSVYGEYVMYLQTIFLYETVNYFYSDVQNVIKFFAIFFLDFQGLWRFRAIANILYVFLKLYILCIYLSGCLKRFVPYFNSSNGSLQQKTM